MSEVQINGNISLLLGGARSGKSNYAQTMAMMMGLPVTYIASAESKDSEMSARIEKHRRERPPQWRTWEGTPVALLSDIKNISGVLLLDCLTLWLSRYFLESPNMDSDSEALWAIDQDLIITQLEELIKPARYNHLIIVSNEVGLSIVPNNRTGRRFRDLQGKANQIVATQADNVAMFFAGLPLWLKKGTLHDSFV